MLSRYARTAAQSIKQLATVQSRPFHKVIGRPTRPEMLLDYPPGKTLSYAELAQAASTNARVIMTSGLSGHVKLTPFENRWTQEYLEKKGLLTEGTLTDPTLRGKIIPIPQKERDRIALQLAYEETGHQVVVADVDPNCGLGDIVYAVDGHLAVTPAVPGTNQTYTMGATHVLYPRMTHQGRNRELEVNRILQSKTHPRRTEHIQTEPFEYGDNRYCFFKLPNGQSNIVIAGIAPDEKVYESDIMQTKGRSTRRGQEEMQDILRQNICEDISVVTVHMRQPFYHFDTTGIITQRGHFFTNPCAFQEESWELLKEIFRDKLVIIPEEDLKENFVGNGTSFADNIYANDEATQECLEIMKDNGYRVNLTPGENLKKSGGGQRCVTAAHQYVIKGGFDFSRPAGVSTEQGCVTRIEVDPDLVRFYLSEQASNGRFYRTKELTQNAQELVDQYRQHVDSIGGPEL